MTEPEAVDQSENAPPYVIVGKITDEQGNNSVAILNKSKLEDFELPTLLRLAARSAEQQLGV